MGRRRKHDGDLGLASDQIPGKTKTTSRIRPCHSLLHHHQAFRGDTRKRLYSTARPKASLESITSGEAASFSAGRMEKDRKMAAA